MSLLALNVNSLTKAGRELELQLLLDELRPAIVALSETEIPAEDDSMTMMGYRTYYPLARSNKFRLLMLLREDVAVKHRPAIEEVTTASIWMKLHLPWGTTIVSAHYRQWSDQEEDELDVLHNSLRRHGGNCGRILAMGDFNLDWSRQKDSSYYRRRLLERHLRCLEELGLTVANDQDPTPTYRSYAMFKDGDGKDAPKESVLDHLYYAGLAEPRFRVLPFAATDHRPILAVFPMREEKRGFKVSFRRNYKSITENSICCAINAEKLSRIYHLDDVEAAHEVLVNEITDALNIVAPKEEMVVKERAVPLYLRADTRRVMRARDEAAKAGNHALYRELRNKANRLVRKDKMESNIKHLADRSNDPRTLWQVANSATGRAARSGLPLELRGGEGGEGVVRGGTALAEHVNHFFLSKIAKIRENIELADTAAPPSDAAAVPDGALESKGQFKLRPPTEHEVHRVILGLNNTAAVGVDEIPVAVLKLLAPVIAGPFSHLIKRSFETAVVPSAFKLARVIPIHKGKNKPMEEASSYRPVSILDAMSKILERVVLNQLSPYLAPHLPPSQFGFRPGRSTAAAIASAHGAWSVARAKGLCVAIAGYDMSSAFDTVDMNMLTDKLRELGIRGRENSWFKNYLEGRSQQVDYNGIRSAFRPVPYGVPQGSILGPVLFLALVSDLPSAITGGGSNNSSVSDLHVGISCYADDVACWVAGREADRVKKRLEGVSAALVAYCNLNYLALNEKKTQVVWAGHPGLPIKVGDSEVLPGSNFEFLGVNFDRKLTVSPHLSGLISSVKSMAIMARRLTYHIPIEKVSSVMGALVRGRVGYSCLVFPPRFCVKDPVCSLMADLQIAVNDVGRAMIGSSRSDRKKVEEVLSESNLPSINRLVIETIGVECWKALRTSDVPNGPLNPLGDILCPSSTLAMATGRTRAAATGSIAPPAKKQVASFIWGAYRAWNSNLDLRKSTTLNAAKNASASFALSSPI